MIDTIALLHQYQRPIKKDKHAGTVTEYIEVTLDDIELANQLAHDVLGKTLDELPPQTRRLLQLIQAMVKQQCEQLVIPQTDYYFSRKTVREHTGWSDGQLKIHCHRLEELEHLLVHGGGRGKTIRYELLYDGGLDKDTPHLMGLIDVGHLKQTYDAQKSGQNPKKPASSQPQVSAKLGASQGEETAKNIEKNSLKPTLPEENIQNALWLKKTVLLHHTVIHP